MPNGQGVPATPAPQQGFRPAVLAYGVVPWLFFLTGPYMLLLDAALSTGLPPDVISSWLGVGLIAGGLLTVVFNVWLRQPVSISITIHGSLLATVVAARLPLSEVVGAYVMAGAIVVILGATGLAGRIIGFVPLPIVFAMVAGVLFPFGLRAVGAVTGAPVIACAAIAAFLVGQRMLQRGATAPPSFWAALAGGGAAAALGEVQWDAASFRLIEPVVISPTWGLSGFMELTVPLALMVVVVHGAQSAGILRAAGVRYPSRLYTTSVGLLSMPIGLLASAPLCVMGPPLAMLVAGMKDGRDDGRWAAGALLGALMVLAGLFIPALVGLPAWLPGELISVIAGLAVISVMSGYFAQAFGGAFRWGAVVTFTVTMSRVSFFGIGAPFWGLVAGLAVSGLLEPNDFRALFEARRSRAIAERASTLGNEGSASSA